MIDVISFTMITYPDGYKKTVWLIDGNVEFLTGKHIPLFIVTFLFILISFPYTCILLTIQFLYKISHYRAMFWVQKLKPLFDAYTGPYKANHRYWTGLLLIVRIVLLVTFSVNQTNNPPINLFAIISVSVLLLGWLSSANWVYKSPLNNILETLFFCNIVITSAAVYFNLLNKKSNSVAAYVSTSVAFIVFVGIILYHAQRQLVLTKPGSKLKTKVLRALTSIRRGTKRGDEDAIVEMRRVTTTATEVKEPLQQRLEVYKSYNSSELKEPLLDDE